MYWPLTHFLPSFPYRVPVNLWNMNLPVVSTQPLIIYQSFYSFVGEYRQIPGWLDDSRKNPNTQILTRLRLARWHQHNSGVSVLDQLPGSSTLAWLGGPCSGHAAFATQNAATKDRNSFLWKMICTAPLTRLVREGPAELAGVLGAEDNFGRNEDKSFYSLSEWALVEFADRNSRKAVLPERRHRPMTEVGKKRGGARVSEGCSHPR